MVGGYRLAAPANVKGTITLGLRAEDVEVDCDGMVAKVRVVEPLGPNQLVTLDIDGAVVRLDASNALRFEPGATIKVRPRQGAVRWFEAETGRRIA
jgi:multiple sugar transport system ATP-binding protein